MGNDSSKTPNSYLLHAHNKASSYSGTYITDQSDHVIVSNEPYVLLIDKRMMILVDQIHNDVCYVLIHPNIYRVRLPYYDKIHNLFAQDNFDRELCVNENGEHKCVILQKVYKYPSRIAKIVSTCYEMSVIFFNTTQKLTQVKPSVSDLCVVCLANKKTMVFTACMHLVSCKSCSTHLYQCPICRKPGPCKFLYT